MNTLHQPGDNSGLHTPLQAALTYSRWGWRALPLEPGGKRAFLRDWPNRASDNPDVITAWWQARPDYNVGVLTGGASGIVVVDVDGEHGVHWWRRLAAAFGVPETATVFTPRGGHYYFQHPGPPVPCSAGRVAEGVDVRGERGYVVAPPSVRDDGGRYVWARLDRPAHMPQWLLEAVHYRPEQPQRSPKPLPPDDLMGCDRWAAAALRAEAAAVAGAQPGQRNTTLNKASFSLGQLVGAGYVNRGQLEAALYDAAVASGLVDDDGEQAVRATIRSGLEAGTAHPRYPRQRSGR
ncbi:bifunctional DNA primase/polymerase [soil metagenome]